MQYCFQPTSTTLIVDDIDNSIDGYCCEKREEDNWWSGGEDDKKATTDHHSAVIARTTLGLWAHLITRALCIQQDSRACQKKWQ